MFAVFNAEEGTQLRALLRYLCLAITAFGVKLPVDQVALVQGALEAVLALFVASPLGDSAPPAPVFIPLPGPPGPAGPAGITLPYVPVDNGPDYQSPTSGTV